MTARATWRRQASTGSRPERPVEAARRAPCLDLSEIRSDVGNLAFKQLFPTSNEVDSVAQRLRLTAGLGVEIGLKAKARNRVPLILIPTRGLEAVEFLRRFLLHVLPVGFQRLRSYGLLANRHRTANLETCRLLLGCASSPPEPSDDDVAEAEENEELWADEVERLTGENPRRCPVCGEGAPVLLETVPSRDELNLRSARAPP